MYRSVYVCSTISARGTITSIDGPGDVPGGDPAFGDGLADGLAPGVNPELLVDVGEVALDRRRREVEVFPDPPVSEAAGGEQEDLPLPAGEPAARGLLVPVQGLAGTETITLSSFLPRATERTVSRRVCMEAPFER